MKKYLVVLQLDVADEGDVGLIKVIDQEELEKTKSISTGFGNMDGDNYPFEKADAVEITEDEFKVLKKFGLTDLEFGYCSLSEEAPPEDSKYFEEDEDDED
jgi:hypothetical protein